MNCPKCTSYVSGDICPICETVIRDRKPLKKVIEKRSEKGKIDDLVYKAKRQKFLRENQRCFVYPELKSQDIHHRKGRIGKNYLDESTWIAVSRKAHTEIETNPEWAYKHGYSESRLKTT